MFNKKLAAFTLAEVLITLAIIGVVAALTIPTVITNYQKKMYVTQLKKTYNNITNGFKAYMATEGVTKLSNTTFWSMMNKDIITIDALANPQNAELKKEFLKIFKVTEIYDQNSFPETQKTSWKYLNGQNINGVNKGLFLADGTWLFFDIVKEPVPALCGEKGECSSLNEFQSVYNTPTKFWEILGSEFLIDVNGAKGPNVIGRDIFYFALSNDGMLYPYGGIDIAVYNECEYSSGTCSKAWLTGNGYSELCTPESAGIGCAGRIMEDSWQMNY